MTIIVTPMESENQVVDPITCKKIPLNVNKKVPNVGDSITFKDGSIYGVLRVLPNTFKYHNTVTGELSNLYNNVNQIEI